MQMGGKPLFCSVSWQNQHIKLVQTVLSTINHAITSNLHAYLSIDPQWGLFGANFREQLLLGNIATAHKLLFFDDTTNLGGDSTELKFTVLFSFLLSLSLPLCLSRMEQHHDIHIWI
jgi:hypothetical protein